MGLAQTKVHGSIVHGHIIAYFSCTCSRWHGVFKRAQPCRFLLWWYANHITTVLVNVWPGLGSPILGLHVSKHACPCSHRAMCL